MLVNIKNILYILFQCNALDSEYLYGGPLSNKSLGRGNSEY